MFNAADLPDTIPVFPLPGALLLPRTKLPLQIFEPRYLAMLDDVLKSSHRLIGMVQPMAGAKDAKVLHQIGCAGRVTGFSETEDGRYMITLKGISRFRAHATVDGFTPYIKQDVSWTDFARDLGPGERDPGFDRPQFMGLLERFFQEKTLESDWVSMTEAEDELLINSLAMLCPFQPEDRQALLEAPTLTDRRETLTTLLQFSLRGGRSNEVMQ